MTHPLLHELLAMLPPPEQPFSRQRRRQWIEAADAVLALVYGDQDDDDIGDAQSGDGGGLGLQGELLEAWTERAPEPPRDGVSSNGAGVRRRG